MEGLGIFGDLPQLDPLPGAIASRCGNPDNAAHTHDDMGDFGDLSQLDQLPAAHVEEDTQQADLIDDLPSLPPVSCRFWNKRQRETRCVNGGNTRPRRSTEQGRQGRVQLHSLACGA